MENVDENTIEDGELTSDSDGKPSVDSAEFNNGIGVGKIAGNYVDINLNDIDHCYINEQYIIGEKSYLNQNYEYDDLRKNTEKKIYENDFDYDNINAHEDSCARNNKKSNRPYSKQSKRPSFRSSSWENLNHCENSNSSAGSSSSGGQRLRICKFYLQGNCEKTEQTCSFLHSQFPCKYYYLGIPCPDENECKLNHGGPLNEEMKEALLLHLKIAPREILGEFKISAKHAKKLLKIRLLELARKDSESKAIKTKKKKNNKNNKKKSKISPQNIDLSFETRKETQICEAKPVFDALKIENFNDLLSVEQMDSLKAIGIRYSYQMLTLSMIELNAHGISIFDIVKIQETINKSKINLQIIKNEPKDNVDMRNIASNSYELSSNLKNETKEEIRMPPEIRYDMLFHSNFEEDEERNLIIDEKTSETSELELLKRDLEQKINKTADTFNLFNEVKKNEINVEIRSPENSNIKNRFENEINNRRIIIPKHKFLCAEPIKNDLENIQVQKLDEFNMLLPFNPAVHGYKPATEYDGSFASHPLIEWKLIEILIAPKKSIALELKEKLKQSSDPRFRKLCTLQDQYSFGGISNRISNEPPYHTPLGNIQHNNLHLATTDADVIDPRKIRKESCLIYENQNHQPSPMQILQHYLHRSGWYNEQNSKTKMETNELIASLANFLKVFKQRNLPNKNFDLRELKCSNQIHNILRKLNIFIDSRGSILPEETNYNHNAGMVPNNFFSGFEPFLSGAPQSVPIISNLVPIGSFRAPTPLHVVRPGLLGMHPNDVSGMEFNNSFRTSQGIISNTMHFGNNIFYGNQSFAYRFEQNCNPLLCKADVQNNSFEMHHPNVERNNFNNRNSFEGNKNFSQKFRNRKPYHKSNTNYDECLDSFQNTRKTDYDSNSGRSDIINNYDTNTGHVFDQENKLNNAESDNDDWHTTGQSANISPPSFRSGSGSKVVKNDINKNLGNKSDSEDWDDEDEGEKKLEKVEKTDFKNFKSKSNASKPSFRSESGSKEVKNDIIKQFCNNSNSEDWDDEERGEKKLEIVEKINFKSFKSKSNASKPSFRSESVSKEVKNDIIKQFCNNSNSEDWDDEEGGEKKLQIVEKINFKNFKSERISKNSPNFHESKDIFGKAKDRPESSNNFDEIKYPTKTEPTSFACNKSDSKDGGKEIEIVKNFAKNNKFEESNEDWDSSQSKLEVEVNKRVSIDNDYPKEEINFRTYKKKKRDQTEDLHAHRDKRFKKVQNNVSETQLWPKATTSIEDKTDIQYSNKTSQFSKHDDSEEDWD